MKLRVYISGPITDTPELNRPAFDAVAGELRKLGYEPLNPHDVGDASESWTWNMRRSIVLMMGADCLVQLPGFTKSAGCVVENNLAAGLRMPRIALTASFLDVQAEATLRCIARDTQPTVPPVDMLAPGWANLPIRRDADATVTADPSVEALRYV